MEGFLTRFLSKLLREESGQWHSEKSFKVLLHGATCMQLRGKESFSKYKIMVSIFPVDLLDIA